MTLFTHAQAKLNRDFNEACFNGSLSKVKSLLAGGADVNAYDGSALEIACSKGHLEIVKYLVEFGVNVNGKCRPLECALNQRDLNNTHEEIAKFLIENKADIKLMQPDNFIYRASFDFIKYLLEKGFKLSKEHKHNLAIKACENGELEIVKFFVKKGFKVSSNNNEALTSASHYKHLNIVRYLVEKGADVKANNNIAIHCALSNKDFELVKYLVEKGADVNTSIEATSTFGYMDIVIYLIDKGAGVKTNPNFSLACKCGDLEMVKYLHLQGFQIDSKCESIIYASQNGYIEVVKYLHQNGADIRIKNDYMVINATCNGRLEVVKYLVENGLDFEAQFALQSASSYGNLEMIKYFLSKGADIHNNNSGQTAIARAAEDGHLNAVKYLHQHGADLEQALEKANKSIKEELIAYKTNFDEKTLMQNDLKEGSLKPFIKSSGLRM